MYARIVFSALVISLATSVGNTASAQGYGYGWGYGLGVGGLYNGLSMNSEYRPPYFAVHPPVYYSHPVPRTYGHSPFAYPPHFRTPDFCEAVVPLTINNPHVQTNEAPVADSKADDETVSVPKQSEPLVVINPFAVPATVASAGR